ncbi:hypothetical protein T484DRAFT_3154890 [Baffinella frigidus]|nr:hypothetical protein T484DRAFT_3154890 [Cryptophyta sp. CCMP2293]
MMPACWRFLEVRREDTICIAVAHCCGAMSTWTILIGACPNAESTLAQSGTGQGALQRALMLKLLRLGARSSCGKLMRWSLTPRERGRSCGQQVHGRLRSNGTPGREHHGRLGTLTFGPSCTSLSPNRFSELASVCRPVPFPRDSNSQPASNSKLPDTDNPQQPASQQASQPHQASHSQSASQPASQPALCRRGCCRGQLPVWRGQDTRLMLTWSRRGHMLEKAPTFFSSHFTPITLHSIRYMYWRLRVARLGVASFSTEARLPVGGYHPKVSGPHTA